MYLFGGVHYFLSLAEPLLTLLLLWLLFPLLLATRLLAVLPLVMLAIGLVFVVLVLVVGTVVFGRLRRCSSIFGCELITCWKNSGWPSKIWKQNLHLRDTSVPALLVLAVFWGDFFELGWTDWFTAAFCCSLVIS